MCPIGRSARGPSRPRAECFSLTAVADTSLAGPRRKHSPERVSQKIELSFRHSANARLFLAHRELQLAHDLSQSLQGRSGLAPTAPDHEVVGVGHEPRAEGSLPPRYPGFSGTTSLSATPQRPACPSRVSGWSSLTTLWGFPCCARFPCVRAAATAPVQRLGVVLAHLTQP
jgi:hypothetical protein